MTKQTNQQLLLDAYRIFFDATDYPTETLIGYCRLIKDILDSEAENTTCDIILYRLINTCKNFKESAQTALNCRYGLSGSEPLTFEAIANKLFMTPTSVQNLCAQTLKKLKNVQLAKLYNVKVRKCCMNNPGVFAQTHHISALNLTKRTHNALSNAGISTIKQFMQLSPDYLNTIKGIGETCIKEILEKQKSFTIESLRFFN